MLAPSAPNIYMDMLYIMFKHAGLLNVWDGRRGLSGEPPRLAMSDARC